LCLIASLLLVSEARSADESADELGRELDGVAAVIDLSDARAFLKRRFSNAADVFSLTRAALTGSPLEAGDAANQIAIRLKRNGLNSSERDQFSAFSTVYFTALKTSAAYRARKSDDFYEGVGDLIVYGIVLGSGGGAAGVGTASSGIDAARWALSKKFFSDKINAGLDSVINRLDDARDSDVTFPDSDSSLTSRIIQPTRTVPAEREVSPPRRSVTIDQGFTIDRDREAAAAAQRSMIEEILTASRFANSPLGDTRLIPSSAPNIATNPLASRPLMQGSPARIPHSNVTEPSAPANIRIDPALARSGAAGPQRLVGTLFNNRVIPAQPAAAPTLTSFPPNDRAAPPSLAAPDPRPVVRPSSIPQTPVSAPLSPTPQPTNSQPLSPRPSYQAQAPSHPNPAPAQVGGVRLDVAPTGSEQDLSALKSKILNMRKPNS
jgi:hypothetical protein